MYLLGFALVWIRYNHNFHDRFCYCDEGEDEDDHMFQCIHCMDWFHGRCVHSGYDFETDDFKNEDFVCQGCLNTVW